MSRSLDLWPKLHMMKITKRIAVWLIFGLMFYYGCKKQDSSTAPSVPKNEIIKSAREYFEKNIPQQVVYGQTEVNSSGEIDVDKLTKNILWDNAQIINSGQGSLVVVPIRFNLTILQRAGFNNPTLKQKVDEMSRLVIATDSSRKYKILIFYYLPDNKYLNNPEKGFSGAVVVKDWSGNTIGGYRYSGDSTYYINTDTGHDSVTTNISQPPPGYISVQDCTTTDYYTVASSDYGSDIHYSYTAVTGCSYSYAPTGSPIIVYQLSQIGIDAKAIGGGTTLYKAVLKDTIGIHTSNPCYGYTARRLQSNGLNSELTATLRSLGSSDNMQMDLYQTASLSSGESAHTTSSNSGGYYKFIGLGITNSKRR